MVDFVFPYVNPSDTIWKSDYKEACEKHEVPYNPDSSRFRDWGFLRYVLRSIDKNMPWINKVHILVHSDSQIPSWVNRDTVNVVCHKDFIPKEFLPTFNSTTIEMFLGNIPGLAEKFIYSNDDFFAVGLLEESDFYFGDKAVLTKEKLATAVTNFEHTIKNCYNLIKVDYPDNKLSSNNDVFYRPKHFMNAFFKSKCKSVLDRHYDDISKSITTFRKGIVNFNQYIYFDDILLSGNYIEKDIIGQFFEISKSQGLLGINPYAKMLCINDSDSANINARNTTLLTLKSYFPDKSKYEL